MAAATAEMAAGDDRRDEALKMIVRAEADSDLLVEGDPPPYLVFNQTHLERWIGHILVELRDSSAEDRLRPILTEMDDSFVRASASLSLDLATAVQQRGEQLEARVLLSRGEALAHRVGSRRQLRRAQRLRAAS
jgi:hypothetical protein